MIQKLSKALFPIFSGTRVLMMPYIQGRPESIPEPLLGGYAQMVQDLTYSPGEVGYLTIDERAVEAGTPHRGTRAKFGRALHTEAGAGPEGFRWGHTWGGGSNVLLDPDCRVMVASNMDNTCAVWDAEVPDTSPDGDIGDRADEFPYEDAVMLQTGEVWDIGILTPHESLPLAEAGRRQFLRIIDNKIRGREPHFTCNPLVPWP